jgi:hypothetical protein
MNDAPEKIWAMQFDKPVDANSQGTWGTVNGLERKPRTEYTRTDIADARIAELQDARDLGIIQGDIVAHLTVVSLTARVAELKAALLWISLGPGYTETPNEAVLEMMRVASKAMKEKP